MRIVYLHGFASSPRSGKAQFFAKRFREKGAEVEIPELDRGYFQHLTITGQLTVLRECVGDDAAVLMGSSLGGYLAALFAAEHPNIEKLILMAPAFRFASRWREMYPAEEMALWKQNGTYPIFHYGYGRKLPLAYEFVEDSLHYEEEPEFSQPALILHGTRDQVVPVQISQSYAAQHATVQLRLFNSGHELTDVLEPMWDEVRVFLGLD